jgi:hypothetical protein
MTPDVATASPVGPALARWRPHRAGIRNVWEYDDQEFAFADGRVILRGPNGSGKSNALALLFPFLIEGTMSSAAMDPFAGGRSMRTLLLGTVHDDTVGGRHFRHDQRLGYVWMEFTRPADDDGHGDRDGNGGGGGRDGDGNSDGGSDDGDPDGNGGGDRHLTIGCGARASIQGDTRSWFFVTDRRVGHDLDLAPGGTPLTRAQLIEALGEGAVFDTAEAYRVASDRTLFDLGADRLGKLTALIRVLRRPQLAGKLNLDLLSEVLSSGLPAVDPTALDDVASSLDDLERVQAELADLRASLATVDRFLPTYREYLAGETLRRATTVVEAQRALEAARRAHREARAASDRLATEVAELTEQREALLVHRRRTDARRSAHLESPAWQSAASLREVQNTARTAASAEEAAQHRADRVAERHQQAHPRAERSAQTAAGEVRQAAEALQQTLDLLDRLGADWSLTTDEQVDPDRLAAAAGVVERQRRGDVREVRAALAVWEAARGDHERAERAASTALEAADGADRDAQAAAAHLEAARLGLAEQVQAWAAGAPGLGDAAVSVLVEAAATVGEPTARGLAETYATLVQPHRDALVAERTGAVALAQDLGVEHAEVTVERDEVAAERDEGPAPPPWRQATRTGRAGAPLWACCDFADNGLDATARAGLEAALDAAGLLDAWIAPAATDSLATDSPGTVPTDATNSAGEFDAWLRPVPVGSSEGGESVSSQGDGGPEVGDVSRSTPPGSDGATLTAVLVPSVPEGSGLAADDVAGVLAAVGLGEVGIAVAPDGGFSLGPLRGRSVKDEAEFIGATARAQRRQRRLAELDARLADLDRRRAEADAIVERTDADLAAIDTATASLPSPTPVHEAVKAHRGARERLALRVEAAEQAQHEEAAAAAAVARAADTMTAMATARRLEPTTDALDDVAELIDRFANRARDAVARRRGARSAEGQASADGELAAEASSDAEAASRDLQQAREHAAAATARAETLEAQVGADAEQAVADLEALDVELERLNTEVEALVSGIGDRERQLGAAANHVEETARHITERAEALQVREARLPVLRRGDLLALLVPPAGDDTDDDTAADTANTDDTASITTEDLPTEPVAFARWLVERVEGTVPDDEQHRRAVGALDRAQKALLDDLHRGYDPSISHDDDLVVVQVTSDEGTFGLGVLAEHLRRQEIELAGYLTAGDQEVFERFLLNKVSHELRRLLAEADEFVAGVNDALEGTATASGLRVELAWTLAVEDADIRQAVRLLRHDTDQMGDEDRAALRAFFDDAIRRQRADDPDAGYRAALERALDYRAWHRFQPHLRSADGTRSRLTRTRFRELSGGEQAVSLHLPLFAAAAAHYARAAPTAPRLVALDEAFAGIDENMRGELMGLTVRFDLDVILTGHELWGAYAEVPAIAVHDLLRRPPAEGVSVFSLRWDGQSLVDSAGDDGSDNGDLAGADRGDRGDGDRDNTGHGSEGGGDSGGGDSDGDRVGQ